MQSKRDYRSMKKTCQHCGHNRMVWNEEAGYYECIKCQTPWFTDSDWTQEPAGDISRIY